MSGSRIAGARLIAFAGNPISHAFRLHLNCFLKAFAAKNLAEQCSASVFKISPQSPSIIRPEMERGPQIKMSRKSVGSGALGGIIGTATPDSAAARFAAADARSPLLKSPPAKGLSIKESLHERL